MDNLAQILGDLSILEATAAFLLENLIIFGLAIAFGHLLIRRYPERRVALPAEPVRREEIIYAISTLFFNTLVTVIGWWLWREGIVTFRTDTGFRAIVVDVVVLVGVMDLAMYLLHRAAHWSWVFPIMHRTHHHYDRPHPLTLFVLNPFEALGFGSLWLIVIMIYPSSWLGMSIYLTLNVGFGMIGHLGVEPLPDSWKRIPLLRLLSTSTFHAQHHQDRDHNFGFYTLIWDRMFGTLSPRYESGFGTMDWTDAGTTDRTDAGTDGNGLGRKG